MSGNSDGSDVASLAVLLIFGGGIVLNMGVHNCHGLEEVSTLKTETSKNDENRSLLQATFKRDLEEFKKALQNGAQIEDAVNQYNQDVLMTALSYGSYDIAQYILTHPELSRKIDYERRDSEGHTSKDILQLNIDATKKKLGEREENTDQMSKRMEIKSYGDYRLSDIQELMKLIQKEEQIQREDTKAGKMRSKTSYAFYKLMKNNSKQST